MNLISLYKETPHAATAMTGFGLAMFVRELPAMTSAYEMFGAQTTQFSFLCAACTALAMAVVYMRKPRFRISRYPALCTTIALIVTISLLASYGNSPYRFPREVFIAFFSIYQSCALALVLAWCESLMRFGSQRIGLIFAGSIITYGICNILTMALKDSATDLVVFLLPLASVALLFICQKIPWSDSATLRRGSSIQHQAFSQNTLMLPSGQSQNEKRIAYLIAFTLFASVFVSRFAFGCANGEWLPLQDSASISLSGQLSNLAGTVLAGTFMAILLARQWNEFAIVTMNVATLVALLLCFTLLVGETDAFARYGIIPLAFGQKIIMISMLLVPFCIDARNPSFSLSISLALSMLSLSGYFAFSLTLSKDAMFALTVAAYSVTIFLTFLLIFLVAGSEEASARKIIKRIEQSAFNLGESTFPMNLPVEILEKCLTLSEQNRLTQRETEVFLLLVNRYDAESIAEMLIISVATAKTHMRKIYSKFGVHSQKDLIKLIKD